MRRAAMLLSLGGCQVVFELEDPPLSNITTFDGLVARYTMDSVRNGEVLDVGPHGIHGSCLVCPDPRPGAVDGALDFNGTNDLVEIPAHPMFETTDGLTVAAWLHLDEPLSLVKDVFGVAIAKTNPNNSTWMMAGRNNADIDGHQLTFTTQSDPTDLDFLFSSGTLDLVGGWHHVALRWDKETQRKVLSFDGEDVAAMFDADPLFVSEFGVTIGAEIFIGTTVSYWPGGIDEIQIYDHALSDTQIDLMFEEGKP